MDRQKTINELATVAGALGIKTIRENESNVSLTIAEIAGRPALVYEEPVKVAGTGFTNPDGVKRQDVIMQIEPGDILRFVPEPDNEFDPNAIKVRWTLETIGYLPKKLAANLQPFIASGWEGWGKVIQVVPRNSGVLDVVFYVFEFTDNSPESSGV